MQEQISKKIAAAVSGMNTGLAENRALADHAREYAVPILPADPDEMRNKPRTRLDPPGIDYRIDDQLRLLQSFRSDRHTELFARLRDDRSINRFGHGTAAVSNTYCNTPDAEIYAAMILERAPRNLVEVGSGYSTLIARKAVEFAKSGTRITAIDPNPRTDVSAVIDEVIRLPVEQTKLLERQWDPNDILFIDSSHICRTRGDLPFLFCRLLPSLPKGVRVHVHDIFLPFDYPNLYDQWWHTEEYLLACTLSHSTRYQVVMATHLLSREHPQRMNEMFGPLAGTEKSAPDHLGCSFWFDVV